jgi:hypothetical protein
LPKPKLLEPVRNLLHWLHRLSGWRLAEFWTTAIKRYPKISRIAHFVVCGNSAAAFAKVALSKDHSHY